MLGLSALLSLSVIWLLVHIVVQIGLETKDKGLGWNVGSRDEDRGSLSLLAQRAKRASKNFCETYPAFLALLLADMFHPSNEVMLLLGAKVWFGARLVYLPIYLAGVTYVRTIVWGIALLGLILMFAANYW